MDRKEGVEKFPNRSTKFFAVKTQREVLFLTLKNDRAIALGEKENLHEDTKIEANYLLVSCICVAFADLYVCDQRWRK